MSIVVTTDLDDPDNLVFFEAEVLAQRAQVNAFERSHGAIVDMLPAALRAEWMAIKAELASIEAQLATAKAKLRLL